VEDQIYPLWVRITIQAAVTISTVGVPVVWKAAQLEQRVEFLQGQVSEMRSDIKAILLKR
jgi:hypothetical protein